MSSLDALINLVLPPRCPFTGEIVDSPGMIAAGAWTSLSFLSEPCCAACGLPFDFAVPAGGADALCAGCLKDPPSFTARSALAYNEASRDFILGFKHGDQTHVTPAMVPWLLRAGAKLLDAADFLAPVPLHRWRLLRRRYNQAALMAGVLGKAAGKPVMQDALIRTRATPTQGHLRAKERMQNVRSAFAINPRRAEAIKDKNILLIDDVYTTGSTVSSCADCLLKGGAKAVSVLTLARVLKS
jgi:ComF family protein